MSFERPPSYPRARSFHFGTFTPFTVSHRASPNSAGKAGSTIQGNGNERHHLTVELEPLLHWRRYCTGCGRHPAAQADGLGPMMKSSLPPASICA
jgi:hypothetical protein